ncbi:hypothetical protein ACFE04_017870 [Oxalis oulophora]
MEEDSSSAAVVYVDWEEVSVSSDKGKREVHYYLKRKDNGGSDLAIVGTEKSSRHMAYHFTINNNNKLSYYKLKSRREVVNWLNSILPDSNSNELLDQGATKASVEVLKDNERKKSGGYFTKEIQWLGSSWMCRKKRKHYQSFRRNGVKISVNDFVYVLAEEGKRLVAFLEDMYEDSKTNKLVVVRWFHKVDEVGIALPENYNDREIFFSLCLQDLSIECIDGLATVLSPQQYKKFVNEASPTRLEPFLCHRQFDNGDIKPFDVTQVKGYWKQEILRYMYPSSSSRHFDDSVKDGEKRGDKIRPRKRHRRFIDDDMDLECADNRDPVDATCKNVKNSLPLFKDGKSVPDISLNNHHSSSASMHLKTGSQIEVLSEDCGVRGCWFRASIIKKHKDKVKVQYQDLQDADDESKKLEEWIWASKVASPDQLGNRISGRKTIRPSVVANKGKVSWAVDVGTAVDVWWHDGWWEGIVVKKESEDKFHVYFSGEEKNLVVSRGELRHSQEWVGNGWTHIKERVDLVSSMLSNSEVEKVVGKKPSVKKGVLATITNTLMTSGARPTNKVTKPVLVVDLSKDNRLAQLKWKTSKRRKRGNHKGTGSDDSKGGSSPDSTDSGTCNGFLIPPSLKMDSENCKYSGDSIFSSSVVPPLTSMVMSR